MQSGRLLSSFLWKSTDTVYCYDDKDSPIHEQFVHNVEDFSSQYGSEISVSYTAFNLRGPPSNFPDYGDYSQAFAMRTYGTWWDEAPSVQEDYMPQSRSAIPSQDFVELSFARSVYPTEVAVFETYNPGALVRIWALSPAAWVLLWEGEPKFAGDTPRIFSPPILEVDFPVRILRLEFNHRVLPYYTELDAVLLKGRIPCITPVDEKTKISDCAKDSIISYKQGSVLHKVLELNLHENIVSPCANKNINATVMKFLEHAQRPHGDFQRLPDESILAIMKYLDLQSLCRCAQVNKHFKRLASDAILYRSLDLRPYWHCVRSQVLVTLAARCRYLRKLDLSWCGSHCMIHPRSVVEFLKSSCSELTHLRLNCCKFVDNSVLKAVASNCGKLQELGLRSVGTCMEWSCLASLKNLTRLDLYRSNIGSAATVAIVLANPKLQHLNVGSCKMISSMDEVVMALGANCPDLISADFWKSYSLTASSIRELGHCYNLQELDVGWCLQAGASGEWLPSLNGGQLRKLYLGALRGVSDRDLRALLPRLKHLTQLDLLGVRSVSADICTEILNECRELRLLDVSFCDQIQDAQVKEWRKNYPHVSIKRSFQSQNSAPPPNALFLAPRLI